MKNEDFYLFKKAYNIHYNWTAFSPIIWVVY